MSDSQIPDDDSTMLFAEQRQRIERPIPRLFREYASGNRKLVTGAILAAVLAPLASLAPPFLLQAVIDAVLLQNEPLTIPGLPAAWVPDDRFGQLQLLAGLIVATAGTGAVLSWLSSWSWGRFSQVVQHDVRTEAYEKIQRLGIEFFESQQTGQILAILNDDVNELNNLLRTFVGDLLRIVVQFVGIASLLVYLHWQLSLVALLFIPLIGLLSRYFVRQIEPKYEVVRQQIGALTARMENNLSGIKVIKSYTTEPAEAGRVRDASRDVFDARWDVITTRVKFFPSVNFVNWLGFGVLVVLGGAWIIQGPPLFFTKPLSVGVLVTFLIFNQQITTPLVQAGQLVDQYYDARASTKRIFALLDYERDIDEREDAIELDHVEGDVAVDDLTFTYEAGEEPALEDVNVSVDAGDFVGVVGPTGSGKTTLTKLLLRFYDPDHGEVRLDGHDLRDLNVRDLRSAVGVVSQEPYLFSGTVRENIGYGTDASEDEIERAARIANADEFVTDLPDGYETQVGQRGVKLSGGQRQRIAIARAVVSDPEVLVLDEATSHVDNETEALIQHALSDIIADRTTFAIAHRLSTVRQADVILVFDDGRVVEKGTHEELLETDGLYADLWRVQVGEADSLPKEFLARNVVQ